MNILLKEKICITGFKWKNGETVWELWMLHNGQGVFSMAVFANSQSLYNIFKKTML